MEKKLPRIKALLTPGEVAKRSGVAVSALHFYESKGLISSCLLYTSPSPRD